MLSAPVKNAKIIFNDTSISSEMDAVEILSSISCSASQVRLSTVQRINPIVRIIIYSSE